MKKCIYILYLIISLLVITQLILSEDYNVLNTGVTPKFKIVNKTINISNISNNNLNIINNSNNIKNSSSSSSTAKSNNTIIDNFYSNNNNNNSNQNINQTNNSQPNTTSDVEYGKVSIIINKPIETSTNTKNKNNNQRINIFSDFKRPNQKIENITQNTINKLTGYSISDKFNDNKILRDLLMSTFILFFLYIFLLICQELLFA